MSLIISDQCLAFQKSSIMFHCLSQNYTKIQSGQIHLSSLFPRQIQTGCESKRGAGGTFCLRLIAEIIITVRLSIVAGVSMWENVFIHFKSKTSFVWKCTVCSSYSTSIRSNDRPLGSASVCRLGVGGFSRKVTQAKPRQRNVFQFSAI